jgi:malate dehydrogenase (oxaloacetate-decarboxylating)
MPTGSPAASRRRCAAPTPASRSPPRGRAKIIATGCGDFPNRLNNSLVFTGLFRGVLDVRARTITDSMAAAVARALAAFAEERGLREDANLPRMDDWEVHVQVAVAAATAAQAEGLARVATTPAELATRARRIMTAAREATATLMRAGLIPAVPEDWSAGHRRV